MNSDDLTFAQHFRQGIGKLFSLTADKADDDVIDAYLRSGIEMKGTNLWVLVFAIFVASIGLNINSAAVVIGAMLISPLRGRSWGLAMVSAFMILRW